MKKTESFKEGGKSLTQGGPIKAQYSGDSMIKDNSPQGFDMYGITPSSNKKTRMLGSETFN